MWRRLWTPSQTLGALPHPRRWPGGAPTSRRGGGCRQKASADSRRSGVLRPEPPARCDQSPPGLAWALPVRSRVQCAQVASAGGTHLFSCARSDVLCSLGAAGADMLARRCAASPAAKRPLRMLRRGAPRARRRLGPSSPFPSVTPHLSPFVFDLTVITARPPHDYGQEARFRCHAG